MLKKNLSVAAVVTAIITLAFSTAVVLARLAPVDLSPAIVSVAKDSSPPQAGFQDKDIHNRSAVSASPRDGGVQNAERLHRPLQLQSQQPLSAGQIPRPTFNADAIFEAVQNVRVDELGNVVLDHDTMVLLQHTLGQPDLHLDELALAELKDLVEYALPGPAGTEVALIAGNYYEFLRAKAAYEEQVGEAGQDDSYADRQRHIQLLRETYLGAAAANQLFAQVDAENEWMHANGMLAANTSLTDEERQQQQLEIRQRYIDRVLQANGWSHRYQQFVQQKTALLAASGDNVETGEQAITDLWATHFSVAEREKMLALQIPVY